MIFFLYVPTESGRTEMATLDATTKDAAITEAEGLQFGGRIGYLFDGDQFLQDIHTAAGIVDDEPIMAIAERRAFDGPSAAPPRPG